MISQELRDTEAQAFYLTATLIGSRTLSLLSSYGVIWIWSIIKTSRHTLPFNRSAKG